MPVTHLLWEISNRFGSFPEDTPFYLTLYALDLSYVRPDLARAVNTRRDHDCLSPRIIPDAGACLYHIFVLDLNSNVFLPMIIDHSSKLLNKVSYKRALRDLRHEV